MTTPFDSVLAHYQELRAVAKRKLLADPIPRGQQAEDRVRARIAELGLEQNVVDLEVNGYTVLRPEQAAPPGFADELRVVANRLFDEVEESRFTSVQETGLGGAVFHAQPRDPIFDRALLQPRPLALTHYLFGLRATLSQSTILSKDKTALALPLHTDHQGVYPTPWPAAPFMGVLTWALTDYSLENGPVCVVPGSHRLGCGPTPEQSTGHGHPSVKPLEVEAGSVILWHGSLWHGALPRTAEGRRLTLVLTMARGNIQPDEWHALSITPERVERNPVEFASLMGLTVPRPFDRGGPDPDLLRLGWNSGSRFE